MPSDFIYLFLFIYFFFKYVDDNGKQLLNVNCNHHDKNERVLHVGLGMRATMHLTIRQRGSIV